MRIISAFRWASIALALSALAGSGSALATTTEFNFDLIALGGPNIISGGINQGPTAGPTSIQSFMNSKLLSGSVIVTGGMANSGYTGDNHVVGPTLKTFGNAPGDPNHVFVMNDNFGLYGAKSTNVTFAFTGVEINAVSFFWEIFPDNTCKNNACLPTLKFSTNKNSNVHTYTANAGTNPQNIGGMDTYSGLAGGTTSLIYTDWPSEIAIRGFLVTYTCTVNCNHKVPEPGSLSLIGVALAGVGLALRRRRLKS